MRIDDSQPPTSQMALEQQTQKLSLLDKDTLEHNSNNSHSQGLSPLLLGPSPTLSPSGDESSGSGRKISFGKVFGRNEQPQSITSTSSTTSSPVTANNCDMNQNQGQTSSNFLSNSTSAATNQGQHNPTSNQNQNHRGSSVPGTPGSPNLGKSRHSSTSSTGSDKDKSERVTRKVFHTWRSVCGKKTKDLFKRWKTLPEHQSEGDENGGVQHRSTTSGRSTPTTPGFGESAAGSFSHCNTAASTPPPMSTVGKIRMLVKKHSQVEMPETETQRHTGWSVHVWATYVQRGSEDDGESGGKLPGRDFLSDFQKVKLTHFFRHVLDMNHDDVISASDFVALNQRIRHYIEWSSECIEFHILKEVHSGFLECFLNQPLDECSVMYYCSKDKETRDHVNIDEWLDVWGELLNGKMELEGLPLWLQYFPKILFQVVNKSGSGIISKEQLRAFYTMFLGIDFRVVNDTMDTIFDAMTDKGRNKITYSLFKLCFANFLFGKYPHGPGQYLFGICSNASIDCPFPIDYSALNTPKNDLEPYAVNDKDSNPNRRSVIV